MPLSVKDSREIRDRHGLLSCQIDVGGQNHLQVLRIPVNAASLRQFLQIPGIRDQDLLTFFLCLPPGQAALIRGLVCIRGQVFLPRCPFWLRRRILIFLRDFVRFRRGTIHRTHRILHSRSILHRRDRVRFRHSPKVDHPLRLEQSRAIHFPCKCRLRHQCAAGQGCGGRERNHFPEYILILISHFSSPSALSCLSEGSFPSSADGDAAASGVDISSSPDAVILPGRSFASS